MNRRPWPIVILAFLHIFSPIPNVLLSAGLMGESLRSYLLGYLETGDWFDLITMFTVLPVGGIAIYLCKKWSYAVFLLAAGITLFTNVDNWLAFPENFSLPMTIAIHAINIGVVSYFLIPAVREMYFNPRMRWWESKPRYLVNLKGAFQDMHGTASCQVVDISEGGAFVRSSKALQVDDRILLCFHFFNLEINVRGRIAYLKRVEGQNQLGYGVQFLDLFENHHTKKLLKNMMQALNLLGVNPKRAQLNWREDFVGWLWTAVTSGTGIFPSMPNAPKTPKQLDNVIELEKHREAA